MAADQRVIADMVAAALSGAGLVTTSLDWPTTGSLLDSGRRVLGFRPHVCLAVHDLDDPVSARTGARLCTATGGRWVVLTAAAPGGSWGGALAAGAVAVLPGRMSMTELVSSLRQAASGLDVMEPGERGRVRQVWSEARNARDELAERIDSLTPRELRVLGHLYEGHRVGTIAREAGVSEETVRSQVKSVLRKLGVGSQIAAVAAYRQLRERERAGSDRQHPGPVMQRA